MKPVESEIEPVKEEEPPVEVPVEVPVVVPKNVVEPPEVKPDEGPNGETKDLTNT